MVRDEFNTPWEPVVQVSLATRIAIGQDRYLWSRLRDGVHLFVVVPGTGPIPGNSTAGYPGIAEALAATR